MRKVSWSMRTRLLVLGLVPLLSFAVIGAMYIMEGKTDYDVAVHMARNAELFQATSDLIAEVQRERGKTAVFLSGAFTTKELHAQYEQTDQKRDAFQTLLAEAVVGAESVQAARQAESKLDDLRSQIGREVTTPVEAIRRYTMSVNRFMDLLAAAASARANDEVGKLFTSLVVIETAKENAGLLRAAVSSRLAKNEAMSEEDLATVLRLKAGVDGNLNSPALNLSEASQGTLAEFPARPHWKEIDRVVQTVVGRFDQGEFGVEAAHFFSTITTAIDDVGTIVRAEVQGARERTTILRHEAARRMALAGLSILAVLIVVLALSLRTTRSITRSVNSITDGLIEGSSQIADAAAQVADASQQLAGGASDQAASLEQTASALQQMASMTRANAENAKQANELSAQTRAAAEGGDQTMAQLNDAMSGINSSAGQISKIIKVIEEIAFQTNLLALNAAVEAARAGEHGKGFAVVADEVRNLAQRAAQASGEITLLIEESVDKARQGTNVANEVGASLGRIVENVSQVADLINGITRASNEQAQGVDQVNTAVSQVDKITQQNAASAEESASAAEQLAAQATTVNATVDELTVLIRGAAAARANRLRAQTTRSAPPKSPPAVALGVPTDRNSSPSPDSDHGDF